MFVSSLDNFEISWTPILIIGPSNYFSVGLNVQPKIQILNGLYSMNSLVLDQVIGKFESRTWFDKKKSKFMSSSSRIQNVVIGVKY